MLASWEYARTELSHEIRQRAENNVANVPRPVSMVDHQAMRAAFELRHYKLESHEVPAKHYIAMKQEEVEEGEPSGVQ